MLDKKVTLNEVCALERQYDLKHIIVFALVALWCACASANTRCVYPSPDGGVDHVSDASIAGRIEKISGGTIHVFDAKTATHIQVGFHSSTPIYTAFGGDGKAKDLKKGQSSRIWFIGCAHVKDGRGTAKYIEVFSFDISDSPPKDYFYVRGQ